MKNLTFKIHKNSTGILIPISLKKDIPFKVKRIFVINGKKNSKRANHAHQKCTQFLMPISGSIDVLYENKKGKFKKRLSFRNRKCLLLEPKSWLKIKFITNNSILVVYCDREYEYFDYINNYDDFLKIIKKTKK